MEVGRLRREIRRYLRGFWMEFEFWLKNRVTWEFSGGESGGGMEYGEVEKVLIYGEIWRVEIELLKIYQCSRWLENNSLVIKAIINYSMI